MPGEIDAKQFLSIKLADVESQFAKLPKDGTHEEMKGLPYFANIFNHHIQGYTQCGDKPEYIFTHNKKAALIKPNKDAKSIQVDAPKGWDHPGGIQTIGRYLFVPFEKDGKSIVVVYSLMELNSGKVPTKKELSFSHMAGCLGITDFVIDNESYYLLAVGDANVYHSYLAKIPDDMAKLSFTSIGNFGLERDIKCQGFGLVTDTKNQIYMIALMSHGPEAGPYKDWGYLIKLDVTRSSVRHWHIKDTQFTSKKGVVGGAGTHFRWGAGIRILPEGKLVLLATSRNIIAGTKLNTNYWRTSW